MGSRREEPLRCTLCGTFVEITVEVEVELPFGTLPLINDSRVPEGNLFVAPPLCWECRGGVLLG